jgi:signal transduction histidine kinase/DNA-binding response OmpR family regulator/HAMP domain-containing protein
VHIHFNKFRLSTKIILWSFVPTAIIMLLVALTLYYSYQDVTADFVLHRDIELTRLSASQVSSGFEDYVDRLKSLARLPDVYEGDIRTRAEALRADRNQLVFFDGGVYILNNLGELIAALPDQLDWIGQDWSDRSYFSDVTRLREARFSDIVPDGPDGVNVVVFSVPILGAKQEFRGVVLGMFRMDTNAVSPFYGTLIRQRIGGSGDAFLIDGNGRVIFATDFNLIGNDISDYPGASQMLAGQLDAQRTNSPKGNDIVISYAPVPRSSWRLIVEEDWADLLLPSQRYGRFLLILLALGVVIPTIVVMFGVRAITGPINNFIQAARNIAGGDFNQSISVHTRDELEDLANQFNTMAYQLKDLYANLEKRVADRTKELTAVNTVSEVVSRSLDLNQILPDALAKTLEVMEMDAGAIFRQDPHSDQLILVAEKGLKSTVRDLAMDLPVEYSIVKTVIESKKPEARLLSNYPSGPVKEILGEAGVKLVVSIPLLYKDEVLGAINVLSMTEEQPSQEELSATAAIGQQIGVAMENARLYAQTAAYAQAMEKASQIAEEANASKSIFVANVTHELRTPLTSIMGFARLVQKRLDERILPNTSSDDQHVGRAIHQVKENLEIIYSESQRLTSLINDVLDLEKIEAGKMDWNMRRLQIADVIHQSKTNTASLFEESTLEFIVDIRQNLPEIIGDQEKLLQVMINLLSNAVKFTHRGRVTIQAEQQGSNVIVSVSDTGIGITPEDLPKVFEKFKQAGGSLTSKPHGTGLGLTIAKEIVEHHGGKIWVESTPGVGSIFTFSLPIVNHPKVQESAQLLQLEPQVSNLIHHILRSTSKQDDCSKCILIAADDANLKALLHQELESEGCEVIEAVNGEDLLDLMDSSSPDILILNGITSGDKSLDFASVSENNQITEIPIISLNKITSNEYGVRVGIDHYITKPEAIEELVSETIFLMEQNEGRARILVVDPNTIASGTIQATLLAKGYDVLVAQNSKEGYSKATQEKPDLLMINLLLLDHDELVKMIRAEENIKDVLLLLYQTKSNN